MTASHQFVLGGTTARRSIRCGGLYPFQPLATALESITGCHALLPVPSWLEKGLVASLRPIFTTGSRKAAGETAEGKPARAMTCREAGDSTCCAGMLRLLRMADIPF
jgi:hypothetical protein